MEGRWEGREKEGERKEREGKNEERQICVDQREFYPLFYSLHQV